MTEKNSEMEYIQQEQAFFTIMCGIKGSSKTYTTLNLMKYYYLTGRYNVIHFISPCYKIDNDQNQYEWMKHLDKNKIKIYVYNKYSPLITEQILKMHSDKKDKVLFIIDDSTSAGKEISMDEGFLYFITTSRHLGISGILICHNLKKVLSPSIRSMTDFFFLFRVINSKLLEGFYEEYLSVFPRWRNYKEFKDEYFQKILNTKYSGFFLDTRESVFDWCVKDWNINKHEWKELEKHKNKTEIKEVKVDKEKDMILKNLERKEKVEEIKRRIMNSKNKK